MDKQKIALIDADSISYFCSKDGVEESIENVDDILITILRATGATGFYLFLSKGKYFRHDVNKEYKGKRGGQKLKYIKTLSNYMMEKYGARAYHKLEADDMVAYMSLKLDCDTVICSPDKDVLKQVPGRHYNYRTKTFVNTSSEDAMRFLYKQALMGDSTDNIVGIPGVGDKKSDVMLEKCVVQTEVGYAQEVLKQYYEFYKNAAQAVYNFQLNFRQVYLLRTDEDFLIEIGEIPMIGDPVSIVREEPSKTF